MKLFFRNKKIPYHSVYLNYFHAQCGHPWSTAIKILFHMIKLDFHTLKSDNTVHITFQSK